MDLDGKVPRHTVRAERAQDVADTIRAANAAHEAIVLRGGGTRLSIGDAPERYDTCLDLTGLRGIVEYEPDDLVVTVQAGTTLAELESVLAKNGQRWPVEVGAPERATVGGTIASAADGPSRLRYFHPRDWTLGVRAVLGDGTVTRAGGRVVKNVTGYDLTKLYAGSFGTLCAITEVSLKLLAIPPRTHTLRMEAPTLDYAYLETRSLIERGLPIDALAIVHGQPALELGFPSLTGMWVRLAGTQRVVERLRTDICALAPFADEVRDIWPSVARLPLDAETSIRLSYPAGSVEPHPGPAGALVYPGVGTMHVFGADSAAELRELRLVLEANGGAMIVERAPAELRRQVGTWGRPRSPEAIGRSLKARFDPNGVLAPGRFAF